MQHQNIAAFPPPPTNKTDWPWAEGSSRLSDRMTNGSPWPKISIITPSLNQGQFIEETIRSVLLQQYPNLEYIIIDGGSNDNSVDIIKKYGKWITSWISEPDHGQSHALNKGFAKASGEIYGYLNSDDYYEHNAFKTIALLFSKHQNIQIAAGRCFILEGSTIKNVFRPWWPQNLNHLLNPFGSTFAQPASFWTRELHEKVEGFNEDSHYCFDREFFLKIGLLGVKPFLIEENLAYYRDHENTKTSNTIGFYEETAPLIKKYSKKLQLNKKVKNKILKQTRSEIRRINIFIKWKRRGRIIALIDFFKAIGKEPELLLNRKILGLFRRLLFFKENNVAELSNV